MRYIISMDGGGSKLICLIADKDGNLVGRGMGGPTNSNFCSEKTIEKSIISALTQALQMACITNYDEIQEVNATLVSNRIKAKTHIEKVLTCSTKINFYSEYAFSIYGAILEKEGGLVQAGTGSFAFLRAGDFTGQTGGWRAVAGDDGSGYYIGRKALKVCARMIDGVGKPTMLLERLLESFKTNHFGRFVSKLNSLSFSRQRIILAQICPIVGLCADDGDQVAIEILEKAGRHLALMLAVLIKKAGLKNIKATVSGGAWKTSPILYSSFKYNLLQEVRDVILIPPMFEPVIGGIMISLENIGFPVKNKLEELKMKFADYMYPKRLFQSEIESYCRFDQKQNL